MAVIKVFSPSGVKTVEMLGNVSEQPYDDITDEEINEMAEETDDGF